MHITLDMIIIQKDNVPHESLEIVLDINPLLGKVESTTGIFYRYDTTNNICTLQKNINLLSCCVERKKYSLIEKLKMIWIFCN